jgi:TPR repeat protein
MRSLLIIAVFFSFPLSASAQDFDKGMDALKRHDFEAALHEWQPLAARGHADAQYQIGNLHEYGRGVPQSDGEAVKKYTSAANQGHAAAQYRLGILYDNGWGVAQNDFEAVQWYRMAAESGHDYAQFDLALMYAHGTGTQQDYVQAYMWMSMAIAQGNNHMVKHRVAIARDMTPAQIARAQRLSLERMRTVRENTKRL